MSRSFIQAASGGITHNKPARLGRWVTRNYFLIPRKFCRLVKASFPSRCRMCNGTTCVSLFLARSLWIGTLISYQLRNETENKVKIFLFQKLKSNGQKNSTDTWACIGMLRFNVKNFNNSLSTSTNIYFDLKKLKHIFLPIKLHFEEKLEIHKNINISIKIL